MISGTIKAMPMKLCTVIVLLKAYQIVRRLNLKCHVSEKISSYNNLEFFILNNGPIPIHQ